MSVKECCSVILCIIPKSNEQNTIFCFPIPFLLALKKNWNTTKVWQKNIKSWNETWDWRVGKKSKNPHGSLLWKAFIVKETKKIKQKNKKKRQNDGEKKEEEKKMLQFE